MLVSLYSGFVDILIEKVRSFAQNGDIPHFDDAENVPPLLCDQFPLPTRILLFKHFSHNLDEIESSILSISLKKHLPYCVYCTSRQRNSDCPAKPAPTPSDQFAIGN